MVMSRLLLVVLSSIAVSNAYPDGAPTTACSTMEPMHGTNTFSGSPDYDVASGCYVIFPSDSMSVRVWDREGAGQLRGVLMQVRDGDNNVAGTWSESATLKNLNCNGVSNSSVTHRNNNLKADTDTQVTWKAPLTCGTNEQFEIRATVVKQYNPSVWTQVVVPLVCDPDYSNVAVMERVRPPLKLQYCAVGSWAILPKAATTSFETRLTPGGWRHLYGAPGFRFVRQSGSTPSANTGPSSAIDGSWYMYYEATGRKAGDMAGLLSPFGIQGCFCFTFRCHMKTDGSTVFTLRSVGEESREILRTAVKTDEWETVAYTMTSTRPVVLLFQVFSSGSDEGDVALDDFKFTPGPCAISLGAQLQDFP